MSRLEDWEREIKRLKVSLEQGRKSEDKKKEIRHQIREIQDEIRTMELEYYSDTKELKENLKVIEEEEAQVEQAKKELIEANLTTGCFDREEIHQSRPSVPGFNSGRQQRIDESRRKI